MSSKKAVDYVEYHCDFCGEDSRDSCGSLVKCIICKRDICSQHQILNYSDYLFSYPPNIWCQECEKIGTKYMEQIAELKQEFESKKEELMQKWKEEAKKGK